MSEARIEQSKCFWAASLKNDKTRSRVAAAFLQQVAFCTYQNNAAAAQNAKTSLSNSNSNTHEPFDASSSPSAKKKASSTTSSPVNTATSISGIWKAVTESTTISCLQLPPPRLIPRKKGGAVVVSPQQPPTAVAAVNKEKDVGNLNNNNNNAAGQQSGGTNSHITPRTGNKQQDGSLQTPRNEDFLATSPSGRQWRNLLLLSERVFGHAISVKIPIQNRGATATRAVALGETWSAFLDASGTVRLCGSGAQGLNCRPGHKFVSIAWVGDFIAMIDDKKDLYVARVSGSSAVLKAGHVLPAFVAAEGQPQKLLPDVVEVSGTAVGLLVLNSAGEVFFYSVQKPRQAPLGGIVPYRASSTVLLSPQLDIFVLDSLTQMLHKCSIQQNHGRPNTPRAIVSLRTQIKALAAGHRFLCCVDSNGGLWVMGWNEVGQLGLGGTDHVRSFQLQEQMSKTTYLTDVACGKRHSVVLSIDGNVYVTGSNKHGQIGITLPPAPTTSPSAASSMNASKNSGSNLANSAAANNNNDPGFPVARRFYKVPLRERCVAIACGPNASMFAMETFRVLVCGNNEFAQLGLDAVLSINPGQIPVCIASYGLYGVDQVCEFVKYTDPMFVCAGATYEPVVAAPVIATKSTGKRRADEDGGCCGGGGGKGSKDDSDDAEPIHDGSRRNQKKADEGCACVIQ